MVSFPYLVVSFLFIEQSLGEPLFVRLSRVLLNGTSSNTLTISNLARSHECISQLKNLHTFTSVRYMTELTTEIGNSLQISSSRVNIWCGYTIGQEMAALGPVETLDKTQSKSSNDRFKYDKNTFPEKRSNDRNITKTNNNGMFDINAGEETAKNEIITDNNRPRGPLSGNQGIENIQIETKTITNIEMGHNGQSMYASSMHAVTQKDHSPIDVSPSFSSEQINQTIFESKMSIQTLEETFQAAIHLGSPPSEQLDQRVKKSEPLHQLNEMDQVTIDPNSIHSGKIDQTIFESESSDKAFEEINQVLGDLGENNFQVLTYSGCALESALDFNMKDESKNYQDTKSGPCILSNDTMIPYTFDIFGNSINNKNFVPYKISMAARRVTSEANLRAAVSDRRRTDEPTTNKTFSDKTFKSNDDTNSTSNKPNSYKEHTSSRLSEVFSGDKNVTNKATGTNNKRKFVQNRVNPKLKYSDPKLAVSSKNLTFEAENKTELQLNSDPHSSDQKQANQSKTTTSSAKIATYFMRKTILNPNYTTSGLGNRSRNVTSEAKDSKKPRRKSNPNLNHTNPTFGESSSHSTSKFKNGTKILPQGNPNSHRRNPRYTDTSSNKTTDKGSSESKSRVDDSDTSEFDIQFVERNAMGLNPRFYYILLVDVADDDLENHLRMLWKKYKTYKFIVVPKSTPTFVYYFSPYPECDVGGKLKAVKEADIETLPRIIERLVWNLHKCKMGIVIYARVPTAIPVNEHNQFHDIEGAKFIGQDGMFMNTLIERMNITPVLFMPRKERMEYGLKRVRGRLTGTFLPILNGSAEICSNGHFVKDYRDRRVDFVKPITLDYVSIMAPKANVIPPVITVLLSFEPSVWIMIALTFFITVFVYTWYLKYAAPKHSARFLWSSRGESVESSTGLDVPIVFFDIFRFFISSPPPKCLITNSNFERILIASVLAFTIVITSSFQGNLVRFLSAPVHYPDIETLKQLEESPLLIKTSSLSWKDIFYSDPILSGLANKVERWQSEKDMHDSDGNFAGFQRINVHSYKYFKDVILTGLKNNATRTLHTLSQNLITYYLAYIVIKDSPYRTRIDSLISQMDQAGLVTKWSADVIKYTLETYRTVEERRTKEKKVFTVEDLSAAFIVLATGVFISGLTLLIEISYQYYHHNYRFKKIIIPINDTHASNENKFSLVQGDLEGKARASDKIEFEFCP